MSEEAMNRDPLDPNKGLNTKRFLAMVFVAFIVLLAGALILVRANKNKVIPGATIPKATSATSPQ